MKNLQQKLDTVLDETTQQTKRKEEAQPNDEGKAETRYDESLNETAEPLDEPFHDHEIEEHQNEGEEKRPKRSEQLPQNIRT